MSDKPEFVYLKSNDVTVTVDGEPLNPPKVTQVAARLTAHLNAWYLDKFGMERQCIVVTSRGILEGVLAVVDLDGELLTVDPRDVYYVPDGDDPERTIPLA